MSRTGHPADRRCPCGCEVWYNTLRALERHVAREHVEPGRYRRDSPTGAADVDATPTPDGVETGSRRPV